MDGPIIERQEKLGRTADNLRAAPEPDPAGRTTTARALQECSVAWVYDVLDSRPNGLTPEEAEVRRARYGPNSIQESPRKPLWLRLLANFTHLMAVLLWIGGIVAFLAQLPQLGVAIWLVVVVNGVFSFWQEYKAERATVALRRLLPSYSRVVRGGIEQRVRAEELVPGDIILLTEGEHISADARLVAQTELRVDQSTLSGESRAVHKTAEAVLEHETVNGDIPNLVFAGTSVAAGRGKAVVYATGMGTAFGKIAHLTQSVAQELSPIQKEMIHVTRVVTFFAIASGVVFFALGLGLGHMGLMNSFIFMMGMIVAFVPEGLLPTVTLSLAMGVQRMAHRHALVKRLSAVETLGCTTVICTDKTGTLTENAMTVTDLWVPDRRLTITGVGYSPTGEIRESGDRLEVLPGDDVYQLLLAGALCNDARLVRPNEHESKWSVLGDPTEAALLVAAAKAGLDLETVAAEYHRIRELPFDSRRKRMSTMHLRVKDGSPARNAGRELGRHPTWVPISRLEATGNRLVFVKGAPREVLAMCSRIRVQASDRPLDETVRAEAFRVVDGYARNGLRVLGVALRSIPPEFGEFTQEAVERDLTLLGLVAMTDPPRPEVQAAVAKCHRAGIRVVMITGDYGLTAESIARRLGIIRGQRAKLVNGSDLDRMEETTLRAVLGEELIFARATPEHKLRVVTALRDMGHIVAVTGDGVNDAPAMKKADIGIAMGLAGTDVAKEAADMILSDDNFASIVAAIEEGRAVFANIKKFITYILTSNTPEAVPFILFALSGGRIPLAINVMQILSIDLGTDLVPALALGAEPPEPGVMDRPPRDPRQHTITWSLLLRAYAWLGLIQSLLTMAAFYLVYWTNGYWGQWLDLPSSGPLYHSAAALALGAVVATQIGNVFAQRTERASVFQIGLCTNRLVWLGIATELLLLVGLVYIPPLSWMFGMTAFPSRDWLFLALCVPALFLADEFRKAIVRRFRAR